MNKRYIKAILIGAATGIYFLGSNAFFPDAHFQFIQYHLMRHVPFWDFNQIGYASPELVKLQYAAVFLRFCQLVLEYGFYFLSIPISLFCLLAKLEEVDEPFSEWILLRRTIKLTGVILLCLYLPFCLIGLLSQSWDDFASPKFPFIAFFSLAEAFKYAVLYGPAEMVLFCAFCWELNYTAYTEPINTVKPQQTID